MGKGRKKRKKKKNSRKGLELRVTDAAIKKDFIPLLKPFEDDRGKFIMIPFQDNKGYLVGMDVEPVIEEGEEILPYCTLWHHPGILPNPEIYKREKCDHRCRNADACKHLEIYERDESSEKIGGLRIYRLRE